uniref:Secreted protein n=2 Tax=Aegilops tauschii subsp. strangulata TaxID=200361 RepID=A0A453KXS7_AEGTS
MMHSWQPNLFVMRFCLSASVLQFLDGVKWACARDMLFFFLFCEMGHAVFPHYNSQLPFAWFLHETGHDVQLAF